jgi:hypothetical protein
LHTKVTSTQLYSIFHYDIDLLRALVLELATHAALFFELVRLLLDGRPLPVHSQLRFVL